MICSRLAFANYGFNINHDNQGHLKVKSVFAVLVIIKRIPRITIHKLIIGLVSQTMYFP